MNFATTVRSWGGFLLTLAFSLGGQLLLKKGVSLKLLETGLAPAQLFREQLLGLLFSKYILTGGFLCCVGAIFWLYVLANYEIGRALPILGGLGYVVMFLMGRIFLREQTTVIQVAGLGLLMAGIFMLGNRP